MIIWSRWGILVFLTAGLGAATGALAGVVLQALLPGVGGGVAAGPAPGCGRDAGWGLHLPDRPVPPSAPPRQAAPALVLERLAQPVGSQTDRQVPVVHPETGQPVWVRPRSTLFFIPVRIWPAILVTFGALVTFLGFVSAVSS